MHFLPFLTYEFCLLSSWWNRLYHPTLLKFSNVTTEFYYLTLSSSWVSESHTRCVRSSGLGEEALKSSGILCYYRGLSLQEYCL